MRKLACNITKCVSHVVTVLCLSSIFGLVSVTYAKVARIEITKRADWLGGHSFGNVGSYEMITGRVYYAVNPKDAANKGITDLMLAPRNQQGMVKFSGDFLILRPKDPNKARGTVLFEVANRGITQVARTFFSLPSGQRFNLLDVSTISGLEDAFVFEQGFTFVWAGWQFDVPANVGLRLQVPIADVSSDVRASYIGEVDKLVRTFPVNVSPSGGYCAADPNQSDAVLTVRGRLDDPPTIIPRDQWMFAREESGKVVPDPCSVRLAKPFESKQLYEVVYRAKGSPIAGLGFAAVRDFLAYLKHGEAGAVLREHPETLSTVLGFGYSQSARFLRSFIYEGFNADERRRKVFDGMFIASGGPGRGDFNSRFAIPGVAGNSVLTFLHPVDVFPFTDLPETDPLTRARDGLLVKAERQHVLPKIFHTYSSTEYWARIGSLAHTSVDGARDLPLHPNTRLYFIAGTPHAAPTLPTQVSPRGEKLTYIGNPAPGRFAFRALLLALDDWVRREIQPPPSAYPRLRKGELVSFDAVSFPKLPGIEFPTYMPRNWRMNFGPTFTRTGIKAFARPTLGVPYKLLVPQVGPDGNERSGILLPHVAVPLATYTGWNYTLPRLDNFNYLAGLVGSFIPFPRTTEERIARRDPRPSIQERYVSPENYLKQVRIAAEALVKQRYVRKEDMGEIEQQAKQFWDYVMQAPAVTNGSSTKN
jgi:hypothetical protein